MAISVVAKPRAAREKGAESENDGAARPTGGDGAQGRPEKPAGGSGPRHRGRSIKIVLLVTHEAVRRPI